MAFAPCIQRQAVRMDPTLFQFIDLIPTPVRIVEVDNAGKPRYCAFNTAALKDAGMDQSNVMGRTAKEIYPGLQGELAHTHHLSVISSAKPLTFDMEDVASDCAQWIRVTLAPITDTRGSVVKILCTQVDITAEKQLQAVESDAESRVRDMEQYIAMAAHDLRSPMPNVKMIAEIIREDFKDLGDGKMELLEVIQTIALKSMDLISDVLAHSIAISVRETKLDRFQLHELCNGIVSILDPFNRCTLTCTECTLAADKVSVQITLQNLIDNALKHNKDCSLSIRIHVSQRNHQMLEFQIEDDGKGITEGAMSFIQAGVLTSSTGFGLAGVCRLVRRLGGDIRHINKDNSKGAAFNVIMPGTVLENEDDKPKAVPPA